MGTVVRFARGVGGLLFTVIGLAVVGLPLYGALSDPYEIDFPGGALGFGLLVSLPGIVPLAIGVFLLRKAIRPKTKQPAGSEQQTSVEPATIGSPSVQATSSRVRGMSLGLALTIAVLSVASVLGPFGVAIVVVGALCAFPFLDPGLRAVRRSCPRTSLGLALATTLVAAALMFIFTLINLPIGVLFVAVGAMSAFSLIDPALSVFRRSWWLSTLLSLGTWPVLCGTIAVMGDAILGTRISKQEGLTGAAGLVFVLPLMAYVGALPLSGIVRFTMWIAQRTTPPASAGALTLHEKLS